MIIFKQYWFALTMVVGTILSATSVLPAHAMSSKCTCHAVLVCGADDCSPSGENSNDPKVGCVSVSATIDSKTNGLSICAFGDCWKGTATAVKIGTTSTLWHGDFRRNADANRAASQIALLLNDGVGFAQISDESGPVQVSLTCQFGG